MCTYSGTYVYIPIIGQVCIIHTSKKTKPAGYSNVLIHSRALLAAILSQLAAFGRHHEYLLASDISTFSQPCIYIASAPKLETALDY